MEEGWKPKIWLTLIYGIIFQPFVFLYVNRVGLFWWYLLVSVITTAIDYFSQTNIAISYIFIIICPIHAFVIARNYDVTIERRWYCRWWVIPTIFIIIFGSIFLFRSFLFEPFSIPASSMSPNINKGDIIIVKKWGYGDYGTFDITMFDTELSDSINLEPGRLYAFYPPHIKSPYVKRLVGLPNDIIHIKNKRIYVNGQMLNLELTSEGDEIETYIETVDKRSYKVQLSKKRVAIDKENMKVPDHHYFFLGDNRDNSNDSRYWGPVPSSNFIGEVIYVF